MCKVLKGQGDVVTAAEGAGGSALLAEVFRCSQAGLMEQMRAGKQDERSGRVRAAQGGQTDGTVSGVPLDCLAQKHMDIKTLTAFHLFPFFLTYAFVTPNFLKSPHFNNAFMTSIYIDSFTVYSRCLQLKYTHTFVYFQQNNFVYVCHRAPIIITSTNTY